MPRVGERWRDRRDHSTITTPEDGGGPALDRTGLVFIGLFVGVEVAAGLIADSPALLSHAAHMLSGAASVALLGERPRCSDVRLRVAISSGPAELPSRRPAPAAAAPRWV